MSYYEQQGDFYAAQGDPFFGAIAGLALGGIKSLFKKKGPSIVSRGPGVGAIEQMGRGVGTMIQRHPVISGAAGVAGTAAAGFGALRTFPTMRGAPGASMRGFHMSKPRKGVAPHLVRNRRMRVTNTKALRRAIRRAEGFSRIAKKVLHFTSPRRVHGRGVFRLRRRKRV